MPLAPIRDVRLWSPQLEWETRDDGSVLIWRKDTLENFPTHMSERIFHWAKTTPERTWMAQRGADGDWIRVSYRQLAEQMQAVAQGLIDLGLTPDTPLMVLSGNSLKHAVLVLAAQHIGIPTAAISTAYSLASDDFEKLGSVVQQLSPGMVFVEHSDLFERGLAAAVPPDVIIAGGAGDETALCHVTWSDLVATVPTEAVAQWHAKTGRDTVAKFLFTSGTTGAPKAVIQTQRMLCANQQQVLNCFAFLRDTPPILLDWAPWNHTASGNKMFNMVLYNGGTYYIDAGKPSQAGMAETIRNLHDISPTWYFNVPVGLELLVEAMQDDIALRRCFFRDLKILMYAGSGLAAHVWQQLKQLARDTVGQEILMTTGLGSTETGPFALYCTDPQETPGNIGIPSQGIEMKLVPTQGKLEVRLKGPNITPGYWKDAKATAAAFDDEGYFCMGDALRFAREGDPAKGFHFDGRIAENFKLTTGTWVATGAVQARLKDALGGLVRDVVIAGEGQSELAALLIPFRPGIERIVPGGDTLKDADLLAHPALRAAIQQRIAEYVAQVSGSSRRVVRFLFLGKPLDMQRGELTEKGSVNQRAVLRNHADQVAVLYSDDCRVIRADEPHCTSRAAARAEV